MCPVKGGFVFGVLHFGIWHLGPINRTSLVNILNNNGFYFWPFWHCAFYMFLSTLFNLLTDKGFYFSAFLAHEFLQRPTPDLSGPIGFVFLPRKIPIDRFTDTG